MPQFVLPLATSTTTRYSQSSSLRSRVCAATPRKKRKHVSESDHSSSAPSSDDDRPDAATNPLSLTPDEIAQYKLAGLSLDQSLPSSHVSGWPHKGFSGALPADKYSALNIEAERGKQRTTAEDEEPQAEAEDEPVEKHTNQEQVPKLRLQHFAVLTTIMHRCLLEGDIERAGRAWALMIRMQTGGKGVDLRSTGYWCIGAELLVRSLDTQMKPKSSRRNFSYDSDSDVEQDDASDHEGISVEVDAGRWGTAEGLRQAKDYYERLIIEHPFKRHFATSISALDFWPCMIACEIYGIQYEQRAALRKLELHEQQSHSPSPSSDPESGEEGVLDEFERNARRSERKRRKMNEFSYIERDKIRMTALNAATQITTRLDERMTVPPFSDSHDLLRLRGMLALYIGDLSVPPKPIKETEAEEISRGREDATEMRFRYRERLMNWERGMSVKQNMTEKAMALFTKVKRAGGDVSDLPADYFEEPERIVTERSDSEE